MLKKKSLNDKQILTFVRLINASKKFLVFLALLGQLVSLLPQQVARATNEVIEEGIPIVEEEAVYDSDEVDIALVPNVSEDTSKRTANEKHFRKMDGTYEVAIYDNEVHYLENGQWLDIDNRFDDFGESLINRSNQFKITFPKVLSENKSVKLKTSSYSIDWKILNITGSSAVYENMQKSEQLSSELYGINQSVIYENVRHNTDIQYILEGSDIKEFIILKEYQDAFSMTFEYILKDLKLRETDQGIFFIDNNNQSVFKFDDLFMIDSQDSLSYDIDYEIIETKKDTYQITILPNQAWLDNASYPVKIDPTLKSTTTSMSIWDTYISQANPTTNYASSEFMYVSNTYANAQYKGLIYFSIPSSIMDQVITYAHLEFKPATVTNDAQINIYKNTESFISSSATWNNAPSYDNKIIDYHIVKTNSPFTFDITKPVKEWQAQGISRVDGFTIAHDDGYGSVNKVYQNGTTTQSNKPEIRIGYEEPSGLKDYWTYTSQDLGMVGTGYVSDYTGNLTWIRNEYQLQNEYLSMSLSFYHNNYYRNVDIGYGDGWRTNYSIEVKYDSTTGSYYMHKPDGNKVYFMNNNCTIQYSSYESCKSISEDGSRMILERLTDAGQFVSTKVTTKTDIEYNFNSSGRLISIRNTKTDHSIWIYYVDSSSLRISYVKDEADNRINFSYYITILTQTTLNLKQDDGTYNQVERRDYYYDVNNNINYIDYDFRYGNGSYTGWTTDVNNRLQYTFDVNNRLIDAYNEKDNFKIQYGYDTKNRVNQVSTTDDGLPLGLTNIFYEPSKTTYTDYEGNSIYYTFDHYGHTVNIMDDYGNSTYYRYSGLFSFDYTSGSYAYGYDLTNADPNYLNNHRLVESSDVIKQQQNPIQNHGFEKSDYGWFLSDSANISFTNEESVLGEKSLKINGTASALYASQQVYLAAGEYKIEGWIKNNGTSPGAYIDVLSSTTKGTISKVYSKDEWTKYELTFTLSYARTVTIKLVNESTQSSAYFDNIQISNGFVDTRYNTVTNNSFESGTIGWTTSGASISNIYESGIMEDILGKKAIKINGEAELNNQAYQTLSYVNGYQGSTLIIGGWAKADAVPNKGYLVNQFVQRDNRFFGIVLDVEMEADVPGPHVFEQFYFPFNTTLEDWQYQMYRLNLDKTVYSVRVYVRYNGEGTAYFDNIQLYHEDISTKYEYNANTGNLISVTKPDGTTTDYGYDGEDNVTSITQDSQTVDIDRNSSYQVEEISMNNVRTLLTYDSVTKQLTDTYVGYDKDSTTQDKWFKTSTTYTSDGQYINTVKDEFGNITESTVDKTIGTVTEIIDAVGNIQTFTYDAYGNLVNVVIDSSTSSEILTGDYEYDTSGRLWKIHRDDYTYMFEYNNLNQITGVKIANISVMAYEYWMDESETYYTDLLKKQTYGNTDYVEFIYTDEKQVKTISFNGVIRYEYIYDSSVNLSIFKDIHNDNIYFYSYDLSGRLEKITDKDGNEITYEYDESGDIDRYYYSISGISRSVAYKYNQTTGEYDYTLYNVSGTIVKKDFNYDNDSLRRLNSIDLIIGTNTFKKLFNYDDAKVDSSMGNATNRIYQIIYQKNGNTQQIHQYSYDENHNITRISIGAPGVALETYDYYYDGFNQLIREDIWIYNQSSKTMIYTYDDQNNITSIKEYAYQTITGTPVSEKKMYYTYNWKDQLSKIEYYTNGSLIYYETLIYDASGNVTNINDSRTYYYNKSMQWDGRQLTQISSYCNSINFKYNDQGIRTQKLQGTCSGTVTTNYTLDGDKVLVETRSNGITLYFTYDVDGSLLSMNYNGDEYFYITNMQGDIIELVDINGNSVVKYKYDAWGNIISQTGGDLAEINPYRYRGYRYDVETGWYYLQSRFYDPAIGRFISSDGLFGKTGNLSTHNMYVYCVNNPVMHSDISGEFPVLITIAAIAYTVWAVHDIYQIDSGNVVFKPDNEKEGGVIENSYKVQNPTVIYGYSIYLRYFSDNKDCFDGSAAGIASEWIVHNAAFDLSYIPSKLGFLDRQNEQAMHANFGKTVFDDGRWYVEIPSASVEFILNPYAYVYDIYQEIRKNIGD